MKTTNYYSTFIEVAEDCPVQQAQIPPQKGEEKTVANIQFEMIIDEPYKYTSDEVVFKVYALKNKLKIHELEEEKAKFFSKGQACLRSSPLAKRYGWGIHCNGEGKVALYGIDSEEYQKLTKDTSIKQLKAMRTKRA